MVKSSISTERKVVKLKMAMAFIGSVVKVLPFSVLCVWLHFLFKSEGFIYLVV